MLRLSPFATCFAVLLAPFVALSAADAPPPAGEPPAPPAGDKPAAPPPIPADGVLLRYKYARGATLKLTGGIKITQTYSQSDQEKPVDRDAAVDIEGEMTFLQIAADGAQAVAEARIKTTSAGETTFTKSVQRLDDRGQVLNDQTNLPPPRPDTGDPAVIPPGTAAPAPVAPAPQNPPAAGPTAAPAAPTGPAVAAGAPGGGPTGGARAAETRSPDPAPLQFSRMVFPEGKVKVGESWTRESFHIQTGAAGAPKMKDVLTVTVKDIRPQSDRNIVVLTYKLVSTPVESIAQLTGSSTTAQGESEFDLEAGVILKATLQSDTTAEAITDGVKSTLKIRAEAAYKVTVDTGAGSAPGSPSGGRGSRGGRGGGRPGGG